MRIHSLTHAMPAHRPQAAVPSRDSAPGDQVEVSGQSAPSSQRAWLWSSLGAAGLLATGQTPGPVGVVLSAEHRKGIQELVDQVQAQGGKFLGKRSWAGKLLNGSPFSELSAGEVLSRVTASPRAIENLWCQPAGDAGPGQIASLATLAAVDTLYLGAEPTGTLENSLRNLYQRGYVARADGDLTRLQAYEAVRSERYITLNGPTRLSGWHSRAEGVERADFFQVSHDPRSLSNGDFAESLRELQAQGWIEDAESIHSSLQQSPTVAVKLFYHGIPVTTLESPTVAGVSSTLDQAGPRCELADRLLVPLVEGGRLTGEDAAKLLEVALQPACDQDALMRLARVSIAHSRAVSAPGQFAATHYAKLVADGRADSVDRLIELVPAFGLEAPESLEFLNSRDRSQGLWALPLSERCAHFQTLARLAGARDARTLLAGLDKPMPATEVAQRVEILTRLVAAESLQSSYISASSIEREYRALNQGDPERTLAALKKVADQALLLGCTEHVTPLTLAELRGWDAGVLIGAAQQMSRLEGVNVGDQLQFLADCAGPGEAAGPTCARYLDLVTGLAASRQVSQARTVFPEVKSHQDGRDFQTLLEHLEREGHEARAGEIFLKLKQSYPGEQFAGALRSALESLALGQGPDSLLRSAGAASAMEVQEGQLRVGSVVLKTRAESVPGKATNR